MELFWKAAAATLLAVIVGIVLGKNEKDLSILLTIAACSMTGMIAFSFLEPVLDYLHELKSLIPLQDDLLDTLIKIVGVSIVSELISAICTDAGNSALGKSLQMAASAAILYLSVPVFNTVLSVIQGILGVT